MNLNDHRLSHNYASETFRGKKIYNKPFRDSRLYFSKSLKRNIIHKEQYLDRKCKKYFYLENRLGEEFIMGQFFNDKDDIIITLAYYEDLIRNFFPCH